MKCHICGAPMEKRNGVWIRIADGSEYCWPGSVPDFQVKHRTHEENRVVVTEHLREMGILERDEDEYNLYQKER